MILYAIALEWCYRTSGNPYAKAIAFEAARNAASQVFNSSNVGFAMAEIEDDDEDEDHETGAAVPGFTAGAVSGAPAGYNATEIADKMHTAERSLPNPLLPDFWAVLALAVVVTLHALVWFIQRWSIHVRARVQYTKHPRLESGQYAHVTPHAHQGAAEIVRVESAPTGPSGQQHAFFFFQRQKYEIDASGTVVTELSMPEGRPMGHYAAHRGFVSDQEIKEARIKYGSNSLHIELPSFTFAFKKQILGPVPVFQFFCASLWLMDEYWKYALFQIFSIGMYESSTVFGKIKNMQALRGMKKPAQPIKVYRLGKWVEITTEELLPGDLLSLKKGESELSVPCDALLLSGTAVVNEAALTGESCPMMKEAFSGEGIAAKEPLEVEKAHRVHMLYGGTIVMQHTPPSVAVQGALQSPDGGCVCYCVRTGFSSSEGKLVRMIEYSQEAVLSDAKEVLALLFLLLIFAIIASWHVLDKGLREGKRSQYELVLRCVLILTSVVPPELPMQTAVAVNAAVFTLFRAAVFCTEPFRVPFAGKVTHALFDKTGTLTTDKLVCVGTWSEGAAPDSPPAPLNRTPKPCAYVLAACHSLVQVGGRVLGDPVETAGLSALGWRYDPEKQLATPGEQAAVCKGTGTYARVLHRYHFSSKLQRMAVLAAISEAGGNARPYALVKGSPEAVSKLLATVPPPGFEAAYRSLAEQGMRVLALAWRPLNETEEQQARQAAAGAKPPPREEIERGLELVGLVAFSCLVRRDSAEVVKELRASSHAVAMATGDAALTALHVARDVGITAGVAEKELILRISDTGTLTWVPARAALEKLREPLRFSPASVRELSRDGYDLCVTGSGLRAAVEQDAAMWDVVGEVKVWARMAPEDKEAVLRALKERGMHTLMCGDGANDVGALKQAHVGLALLSGFGGANTAKEGEKNTVQETAEEKWKRGIEEMRKAREKAALMAAERKKNADEMKKWQMDRYNQLVEEYTRQGDKWATFKALKQSVAEGSAEVATRKALHD